MLGSTEHSKLRDVCQVFSLLLLVLSLSGCTGCLYGRPFVVHGTNEHRCLDP